MHLLLTSTQKQISTQVATKFMNSSDKRLIMARKCLTPTVLIRMFSISMKFEILIISNLHLKVLLSQNQILMEMAHSIQIQCIYIYIYTHLI